MLTSSCTPFSFYYFLRFHDFCLLPSLPHFLSLTLSSVPYPRYFSFLYLKCSRSPFPLDISLLLPSLFYASSLSLSLLLLSLLDFLFYNFCSPPFFRFFSINLLSLVFGISSLLTFRLFFCLLLFDSSFWYLLSPSPQFIFCLSISISRSLSSPKSLLLSLILFPPPSIFLSPSFSSTCNQSRSHCPPCELSKHLLEILSRIALFQTLGSLPVSRKCRILDFTSRTNGRLKKTFHSLTMITILLYIVN